MGGVFLCSSQYLSSAALKLLWFTIAKCFAILASGKERRTEIIWATTDYARFSSLRGLPQYAIVCTMSTLSHASPQVAI
jgi:hypothetical protein